MTTLVTGATGFVGSAVARHLLAAGHTVRVLSRSGSDTRNIDELDVERVTGDLIDRASLDAAIKGCEALFHVAADYRLWAPQPEILYRANVEGTRHLMLAAAEAGVRRIVYTSSVAVLAARADGTAVDEEAWATVQDMVSHYKRSKFLAEEVVRELVGEHGLPAVIVNPSAPIGPRDIKPTPTGRIVVDFINGRMPAYVDTGLNLVHVEDCARGHLLAFEHGQIGERYILGGEDMTLRDILFVLARLTGLPAPRLRLPRNVLMPVAYMAESWARVSGAEPLVTLDALRMARKRMFFSSGKAERILGYSARPAEDALSDAIAWFRAHGYLNREVAA